jgi:hypothetical protein
MNKHDELRSRLDIIDNMERGEASRTVTEILKYFMDSIRPERSKREDVFVIKGSNECIAMDATPSKECDEYHKNSYIQINGQLRRCGALNSMET